MVQVRLNKIIDLFERGQTVFSCSTIPNGNYDEFIALSRSAYDMITIETEHLGFDFPILRHSMQYLLNASALPPKVRCSWTSSPWCAFHSTRVSRTNGSSNRRWMRGRMAWCCRILTRSKAPQRWVVSPPDARVCC